jgi:hypothetical protein
MILRAVFADELFGSDQVYSMAASFEIGGLADVHAGYA